MGKNVSALDMLSTPRRRQTAAEQEEPITSGLDNQSTSTPVTQPASSTVDSATSALVTETTSTPVVAPAETAPRETYTRTMVSMTPNQQRWLKATVRSLDTEGLSMSDLTRLALARLQADVEAGLPLLDLLVDQAHEEAKTFTGRRNRGLPGK